MAGTYTDIVEIDAPSSAVAGETVDVTIKIKNIYDYSFRLYAVGVLDSEERFIDWLDYWVPAGATRSFSGSFVMPDKDVTIHAYSYYEDADGYMRLDDEDEKDVSVSEVLEGTISRKELDYEDRWQIFPLYGIPAGTRTRVRITGRNDMASNQKMGIHWIIEDPDGYVWEYSDWETFSTGPGDEQEFRGGSFDLDKVGTYKINIALSMNPADPEIVDTYYGTLCTVEAAVPEPSFRRFGVEEYIKA